MEQHVAVWQREFVVRAVGVADCDNANWHKKNFQLKKKNPQGKFDATAVSHSS
jgi:hypothetical protein